MQSELGRMTMAERLQEISGRASFAALARATSEAEEDRQSAETQVAEAHETESENVRGDGKRKYPFAGRRKKDEDVQEAELDSDQTTHKPVESRALEDDSDGQNLDVTV
jgi:ribosomal protein S8E